MRSLFSTRLESLRPTSTFLYLTGESFDQAVPLLSPRGKSFNRAVDPLYLTGKSFDQAVDLLYPTGKSFDQAVDLLYLTGKSFDQAVPLLYPTGESFDRPVGFLERVFGSVRDFVEALCVCITFHKDWDQTWIRFGSKISHPAIRRKMPRYRHESRVKAPT